MRWRFMKGVLRMTIDKTIEFFNELECHTPQAKDARNEAIDVMRKYQKIQEILKWNKAPSPYYKPDGQLFREICEVIDND